MPTSEGTASYQISRWLLETWLHTSVVLGVTVAQGWAFSSELQLFMNVLELTHSETVVGGSVFLTRILLSTIETLPVSGFVRNRELFNEQRADMGDM